MADPGWSMNLDVSSPQFDPQKVAISKPWVHRAALIAVAYAARALRYRAVTSRGVPVYAPAFAGINTAW